MTYETTVRAYKNIPFQFRLKKNGYYDITGSLIGGYIAYNLEFQPYTGLNMSYYQGTGSLMTVTADSGDLPDGSSTTGAFGCLEEAGQSYAVKKLGYVNYTTAGTPTIDINTGEVTGFSSSNYLKLPTAFNPTDNSWEIRFKFKTNSTISTNQKFFHSCSGTGSSGRFGIGAQIYNSKFNMFVSSNGSSWLLDEVGTYTPLANTTYWVKVGWTGTEYYFEYSTDGETYTRDITYSSTSPICTIANSYIGVYSSASFEGPWLGSIYLSETNIYVNGSEYWNPVGDYNTTAVGLLPTGVTDDGSAQTWNLFYNNGDYRLNTTSTMTGYTWCGSVAIPAHTV